MLGLEEAVELRVVHFELEVAKEPAHEQRVLDLLDRPRDPEERLVLLSEMLGQLRPVVLPDRREPGPVAGGDQLGRVRELHQRVAPVEENRFQHGRQASLAMPASGAGAVPVLRLKRPVDTSGKATTQLG